MSKWQAMKSSVKARIRGLQFVTHPIGALIFPSYILRSALCREIRRLAPKVSGDVLDFGCGSKPYEKLLTNSTKYIGIDVEISGHDHKNSKVDVFFDGTHIPFDDCSFDSVVCFDVFEHVPDIQLALEEINRVLKPDGVLLASIPFAFPEHETPYDFRRLTRFGLSRSLSQHGFTIVDLAATTSNFLSIQQLFIAYLTDEVIGKKHIIVQILTIPMVAVLNVMAFALNYIFPKRNSFPLSFVMYAEKNS